MPETPRPRSGLSEIPVDQIRPNPHQPRGHFDPDALEELAASIRAYGVLQPLLVTEAGDGGYVLLAGERRLRAARHAGFETVPAVVREKVDATHELEIALVENLQRRDLTPLEEARAYEHLRTRFGLSQAEIADRVGIDRSTVANSLRLLRLAEPVQELVERGQLSAGHARALLAFTDPEEQQRMASRVVSTGMTVRELEQAASDQRRQHEPATTAQRTKAKERDPNLVTAESQLSLRLGARVQIATGRRGGKITITCSDNSELMRVFDQLMGESDGAQHQ
jgi:ParB family chromosome partitioning protein